MEEFSVDAARKELLKEVEELFSGDRGRMIKRALEMCDYATAMRDLSAVIRFMRSRSFGKGFIASIVAHDLSGIVSGEFGLSFFSCGNLVREEAEKNSADAIHDQRYHQEKKTMTTLDLMNLFALTRALDRRVEGLRNADEKSITEKLEYIARNADLIANAARNFSEGVRKETRA